MSSYKDIFTNLLIKTHFAEEKDDREYDYEGDMAKSQLKSIITNAQKLHDMLEDDTNLPEWVQLKITLAEDYVVTAANYMDGEEDLDEEVESVDEAQKKLKPYRWRAEWRLGTQTDVDKNNKKIYNRLAQTDPDKAKAFHDNLMRMKKKDVKEEVEQIDELKKSTLASYVKGATRDVASASRLQRGYETDAARSEFAPVQRGSEFAAKKMRKLAGKRSRGIAKAVDRLAKEEVETVEEGAKDWKKAFGAVATKNLNKDIGPMRAKVSRLKYIGMQPKVDERPKVTAKQVKHSSLHLEPKVALDKVSEEVTYFSGTTVSGKAWKFIPPAEPKMLSPEFVKDRVPTLTDKEAHEVSVVAKDQYDDVAKKFAEMSEAKAGTVPKTPRERELAAKADPKHLITRKDVLHARGIKLGEEELRERIREKLGAPGKTMTKKPADPVVFHPMDKKKPVK